MSLIYHCLNNMEECILVFFMSNKHAINSEHILNKHKTLKMVLYDRPPTKFIYQFLSVRFRTININTVSYVVIIIYHVGVAHARTQKCVFILSLKC